MKWSAAQCGPCRAQFDTEEDYADAWSAFLQRVEDEQEWAERRFEEEKDHRLFEE